jgi:hypothetical protein
MPIWSQTSALLAAIWISVGGCQLHDTNSEAVVSADFSQTSGNADKPAQLFRVSTADLLEGGFEKSLEDLLAAGWVVEPGSFDYHSETGPASIALQVRRTEDNGFAVRTLHGKTLEVAKGIEEGFAANWMTIGLGHNSGTGAEQEPYVAWMRRVDENNVRRLSAIVAEYERDTFTRALSETSADTFPYRVFLNSGYECTALVRKELPKKKVIYDLVSGTLDDVQQKLNDKTRDGWAPIEIAYNGPKPVVVWSYQGTEWRALSSESSHGLAEAFARDRADRPQSVGRFFGVGASGFGAVLVSKTEPLRFARAESLDELAQIIDSHVVNQGKVAGIINKGSDGAVLLLVRPGR